MPRMSPRKQSEKRRTEGKISQEDAGMSNASRIMHLPLKRGTNQSVGGAAGGPYVGMYDKHGDIHLPGVTYDEVEVVAKRIKPIKWRYKKG